MTRRRPHVVAALCLLWLVTPIAEGADPKPKPRAIGLTAVRDNGAVRVSYQLADALTAEVEERIQSGIAVTFRHRVELSSRRWLPLTPDRVVSRTIVETRAKYDSLTRRYDLFRRIEQKARGKDQVPRTEEQRRLTDSVDEMRAWMTDLQSLPVHGPPPGQAGNPLSARVHVGIGRDYLLWIFPSTVSVSAETVLEP